MVKLEVKGGGDDSEDWIWAYEKILYDIRWSNRTKLVIHIADFPIHWKIFIEKKKNDIIGNKI